MVSFEQSYPDLVILIYREAQIYCYRLLGSICNFETGIIFDSRTDENTDRRWENIIPRH